MPGCCVGRWRVACLCGGVAQLGEHLLCKQGVVGSIPSASISGVPGDAG